MRKRGIRRNERGASAVEYGLFAAGIAAAIILPIQGISIATEAQGEGIKKQECHARGMVYPCDLD